MKRIFLLVAGLIPLFLSIMLKGVAFAGNSDSLLIIEANQLVSDGNKWMSKSSFHDAEDCFNKSIDIWTRVEKYDEYKAYPYYSLALLYLKTGDFSKSINNFNNAEKILLNAREEYKYLLGATYSSMGSFFLFYGDYSKALIYFDKAIEIYSKQKSEDEVIDSYPVYGKAQTFFYQNKFQLAINYIENYLRTSKIIHKSQFERLISSCLIKQRKYREAKEILYKALAGSKHDPDKYTEILLITAKACIKKGGTDEADILLKEAVPLLASYKSGADPWNIYYYELQGQLDMNRAGLTNDIDTKQDFLYDALKMFDKALLLNTISDNGEIPYLDKEGDFITPTQVKDVFINRAIALNSIAGNYKTLGNRIFYHQFLDLSMKTWEATVLFLHDFRISFLEEESKLSLSESEVNVYDEGFFTAQKLYKETGLDIYYRKMLFFSESGKSSTLLASLNDIQAQHFGGLPDSILRYEKDLNLKLSALKQLIFNENNSGKTDSARMAEWNDRLFDLEKQHDNLMFSLEHNYPDYYNFKYRNTVIQPGDIQKKLRSGQALVEYLVEEPGIASDSGSVNILIITKNEKSYYTATVSVEYVKHIQHLITLLSNRNAGETDMDDFREFVRSSHYLYSVLIKPFSNNDNITDLIVVPDGKLAYLPFDVLISEIPDTSRISFSAPDYLIRRYTVEYSYSATLHFDYFNDSHQNKGGILAFAPEYSGGDVDINKTAYRKRQVSRALLRPLPGAREEVINLKKMHNCKACIGADATEEAFKQEAGNYGILHLAMHTIMNDSIPMFSKLVFASSPDSSEDGYLNTQEIYNMKLNARLAVLSACNTGSGQMRRGEGVMSMARAFLYAGCPSIVMTLWEVEDKSSTQLVLDFYRYLFKGYSKPEALRKAKLEYLQTADPLRAHPYFWMGYILIGDPSPIKYNTNVLISILVFSLVLLILYMLLKKQFDRIKEKNARRG